MKKTLLILAVMLSGLAAGVTLEANTKALEVSRLTGAPYFRVLNLMDRIETAFTSNTYSDEDSDQEGSQS